MIRSRLDRFADLGIIIIIIGFTLFCLLPFLLVAAGSVMEEKEIIHEGYKLIPKKVSGLAYQTLLKSHKVGRSYFVTGLVTSVGAVSALCIVTMAAYGLSVRSVKYRNAIAFYFFFTLLFSGGLTPTYLLVSKILGLSNKIIALIFPYLFNAWWMFIMRNYFQNLPDSLRESAELDGANDFRILFSIILPVSTPVLATIGLFIALQYWNDWWLSLLYIDDAAKQPLQMLLRRIISDLRAMEMLVEMGARVEGMNLRPPSYSARMAATLITIGPIILLYPILQRYYIHGLTIGSIKG